MQAFQKFRLSAVISLILLTLTLTGASPLVPTSAPWDGDNPEFTCETVGQVITGTLTGGQQVGYSVQLEPGDYTIAVWGSWDLVSLGLSITGSDGTEIGSDTGMDNLPAIEFTLHETDTIHAVLTAGDERMPGVSGSYSFVVARGWNCFHETPMLTKPVLDIWTNISQEEQSDVVWWDALGITGDDSVIIDKNLPSGSYTLIAETISSGDDIDMYVRAADNTVIARDEYPNNYPLCYFELENTSDIRIEIDPWTFGEGNSTEVAIILARNR